LQATNRFFLKKEQKLKSRKAIDLLFANGNSFSNFPFRICWMQTDFEKGVKAGFSATSRNFKHATDRNKIKRLIREAYRLQKNNLENAVLNNEKGLHLFFIYTGKDVPSYDVVFEKTGIVLKRILKLLEDIPKSIQIEIDK
jgi:ribonuclease P protein component